MTQRLFGMETEYALVSNGPDDTAAERLLGLAAENLCHLRGAGSSGIFTSSGARFYIDVGHHPEWATPETDDPAELVGYLAAGDATLCDLVGKLCDRLSVSQARKTLLLKCNIDYACPGTTWASHESYLHGGRREVMPKQLVPHLVSRVYTGAGGLNPLCPGIQLSLSPRLHLFVDTLGSSTTSQRTIFNCRDESLSCPGYQRLHVISGDSLCSQEASYLKIATTALVVAMAEAGLNPGGAMELKCPLVAMHSFALDPTFKVTAERANSGPVTALDIQRHYLRAAEEHVDHPSMPAWAAEACVRWRAALDRLSHGPHAANQVFDWEVKHTLFRQHIKRRGMNPAMFPVWNQALTAVRDALRRAAQTWCLDRDTLFGSHPAVVAERNALQQYLRDHGLKWEQADELLRVRAELCEIDVRYAQVTPPGLFSVLEPQLNHRVVEPRCVIELKTTPPRRSRARLRGEQVRKLSGKKGCAAEWHGVFNNEGMFLDLTNPFEQNARWTLAPRIAEVSPVRNNPVTECIRYYDCGDYAGALTLGQRVFDALGPSADPNDRRQTLRVIAWTRSRQGDIDGALAALNRVAAEERAMPLWLITDYIAVWRASSVFPSDKVWSFIEVGEPLLRDAASAASVPAFLGQKGAALAHSGRSAEALTILRAVCAQPRGMPPRIHGRNLADLADALYRCGEFNDARSAALQAEVVQTGNGLIGDLADSTMTLQARLNPDVRAGYKMLRKVQRMQLRSGSRVGLVRTLLLQARICGRRCRCNRLRVDLLRERGNIPSLRDCQQLGRVLDNWRDWIAPLPEIATGAVQSSRMFLGL